MKKLFFLVYGIICYCTSIATIIYAIGFFGNVVVSKTIDEPTTSSIVSSLLIDLSLLSIPVILYYLFIDSTVRTFYVKHIPLEIERSTNILILSVSIGFIMWQWRPFGVLIWSISSEGMQAILNVLYFSGWAILFATSFLINHFDLLGLQRLWSNFRSKPFSAGGLIQPIHFRIVRHPLCFGILLIAWSSPVMTIVHLILAMLVSYYLITSFRDNDFKKINKKQGKRLAQSPHF